MQTATGQRYQAVRSFSTLIEMLQQSTRLYGTMPAFRYRDKPDGDEQIKTYQAFLNDINCLGTALMALPLKNKRFAILGKNSYEWVLAFYSVINGAGVVVPMDQQLPEGEVKRLVDRGGVDVLFYDQQHAEMANAVQETTRTPLKIVALAPDAHSHEHSTSDMVRSKHRQHIWDLVQTGRKLLQDDDRRFLDAATDQDRLASLIYTSGTTARPKGVMLSQKNICSNIRSIAGILPIQPGEKLLSILPLHHTFENTAGLHYLLYSGGCICFNDGLRYFLKNMKEWQIEVMIAVPLLFEKVYDKLNDQLAASNQAFKVRLIRPVVRSLNRTGVDIRRKVFQSVLKALGGHLRLVVVGAAAIDRTIIQTFNDFGIDFFMGYGLTEASPVVSCCNHVVNVIGSVGPPLPDIEVAIKVDETSEDIFGEILTRSDSVMMGYEDDPEETAAVLTPDGWLKTGDVGYFDRHGALHLTGRLKTMIVLNNGKKAFPEEIESLINQVDGVFASFVCGDQTETDAVSICALVQVETSFVLPDCEKEADVGEYLNDQIAQINQTMPTYKRIRFFMYTEADLILTTTLKIRRSEQQRQIEEWFAQKNITIRQANGCAYQINS